MPRYIMDKIPSSLSFLFRVSFSVTYKKLPSIHPFTVPTKSPLIPKNIDVYDDTRESCLTI